MYCCKTKDKKKKNKNKKKKKKQSKNDDMLGMMMDMMGSNMMFGGNMDDINDIVFEFFPYLYVGL
jgi:hypothetical protein